MHSTSAVCCTHHLMATSGSRFLPLPFRPICARSYTWNPLRSSRPGFGTSDRGSRIGKYPKGVVTGSNHQCNTVNIAVTSEYPAGSTFCCFNLAGRLKTELGAFGDGRNSSESAEVVSDNVVYQGVYGPWSVESSDIREVMLYRSGLVASSTSFVFASSVAFLNESDVVNNFIHRNLDLFYGLGGCGLGLSLYLIHIYVKEIKQTLQALWFIGVLGSVVTYSSLAHPLGKGLVEYVVENPGAVWFVGPFFAALTGLVFKEGLCYGKLEAFVLTFIIPSLLLGHLTGIMDNGTKLALLGVWMALFAVFAGRKFTQPIKDDIGDKSVFIFNALPPEEKAALIEKLEQQNNYR